MDYKETLKYINETPKFSKMLGNDDLKKLLFALGNPQNSLKFIHIAGTNGKGSVCAMTASILEEAGYKTGLYTSPFIEVFNERIQINGENISDSDLAEIASTVKKAISQLGIEISVFAQITAMAFIYFSRKKCDFVVLETGLGGRLDATNVIASPAVCAITKIGLDHTEYLGDTLEKIALEKCGIIKDGVPLVCCAYQDSAALKVITEECARHNSPLIIPEKKCDFDLSLKGSYQQYNAQVAAALASNLGICYEHIKAGLKIASWIARFEFIRDNLVLDGGHNPDGFSVLCESLKAQNKPIITVFSMMSDKDYEGCARLIESVSDKIIVTELDMPRCASADMLSKCFHSPIIEKSPVLAVKKALQLADSTHLVCVCGSLYLAGAIRSHFKE